MLDACEAWLVDPKDEDRFDISPRDSEILVVYLDHRDTTPRGEPRQKKETLKRLLERVETGTNIEAVSVQSKAIDNRKLYLDAFKTLTDRLDQIARRGGLYQKTSPDEADTFALIEAFTDRLIARGWESQAAREFAESKYGAGAPLNDKAY